MNTSPPPSRFWTIIDYIILFCGFCAAAVYTFFLFSCEGCALVRFYVYALGLLVIGLWLTGVAISFLFFKLGEDSKNFRKLGKLVLFAVNLCMVIAAIDRGLESLGDDYRLTSTPMLMELALEQNDRLAIWELGQRKASESSGILVAILEDSHRDVNARLNAITSLGFICTERVQKGDPCRKEISALIATLDEDDEFLQLQTVEALGRIGDECSLTALKALVEKEGVHSYIKDSASVILIQHYPELGESE